MKTLYFSNIVLSSHEGAGVIRKVSAQCRVMDDNNIDVYLACFQNASTFYIQHKGSVIYSLDVKSHRGPAKDFIIFKNIFSWIINNNINVVYSRYETYSIRASYFYHLLKKQNIRVLVEIPTYPISQRWNSIGTSIKTKKYGIAIRQVFNSTVGSLGILFMKYGVDRIVNNNGYDKIWRIPTIKITNGVDVMSTPIRKNVEKDPLDIKLIAVASVAKWHGYDRIIRGLSDYYQNKSIKYHITFDIVGPGQEIENLQLLVEELSLKEHVKFLGFKTGDELSSLIDIADIGVSVLGVHRNNMNVCDSLKSREYSARCIPFITEASERAYIGVPFVLFCPSDETNIDMLKVIDFHHQLKNLQIGPMMREFAFEHCDWRVAFMPVCNYINSEVH